MKDRIEALDRKADAYIRQKWTDRSHDGKKYVEETPSQEIYE